VQAILLRPADGWHSGGIGVVRLRDVAKVHGQGRAALRVLDALDLDVEAGELIAVTGRSDRPIVRARLPFASGHPWTRPQGFRRRASTIPAPGRSDEGIAADRFCSS
jgi:hypothetical protein